MKIKDFLSQKISNFKTFIDQQFETLKFNGLEIPETNIMKIRKDFENFENDTNNFAKQISFLVGQDIDDCVKIFLMKYEIDIKQIKDIIDYEKLKKYISMFIDILK